MLVCVCGGSNINDINLPPPTHVNARSPINLDFRSAKKGRGWCFFANQGKEWSGHPGPSSVRACMLHVVLHDALFICTTFVYWEL